MDWKEKNIVVLNALYEKRREYFTAFDIRKGIEDKISEDELEFILEKGVSIGSVLFKTPKDVDGNEIQIAIYKLSPPVSSYIGEKLERNKFLNDSDGSASIISTSFAYTETTLGENEKMDYMKLVEETNLFCPLMPMKIVIEYFKPMTEKISKNKKPFLTIQQLIAFIQRAFLKKKNIGKQTLNYASKEKLFVIKYFYKFYAFSLDYENSNHCKEKYIRLVSDNFTNWGFSNLKNNFGNKVKKEW